MWNPLINKTLIIWHGSANVLYTTLPLDKLQKTADKVNIESFDQNQLRYVPYENNLL